MKTLLVAAALVGAVNAERAEHGLPALQVSKDLSRSADAFAHRLTGRGQFRHERRIRVQRGRYSHVGETLALNLDVAGAVRAWMASPPHRQLLLSPKFRLAGAGHAGKIRVLHLGFAEA